ncbi:MAG TPA: transketolase C-terminal domain-containing protein [Geminicoccaceae bacterium]|nr:transketolase C-terminal domain-containing protein [Geminicoccaceae bacterium]
MTSDRTVSEGQDQSDLFRGVSGPADLTESESVKGTPASRLPAFVLGEELAVLADRDPRIVVLTADLASANRTVEFKARHPDRFFDFGIAEKNMITAAAGMAACGQLPYAATFAAFSAILCAEQIRTDCAYPGLPVRVIGTHSGISMGFYGTSHHATEDLGMLRTVAGLTVVCTTDANHLRGVLRASVDHPGAMYIRLGRGRDPEVYPDVPAIAFGRAIRLREGRDLTIIATGAEVRPALDAAASLAARGIEARVVDMHTIKPLDEGEVRAAAAETGAILTVEEHNVIGGLGSAVAEVLVDCARVPFRRHGIDDEFAPVGPPAGLYAHYKLDADGIAGVARDMLAACKAS